MVKKLKTDRQIETLQKYFKNKSDKWPKQDLNKLSKQTKLTKNQVYKWLWDKRNEIKIFQKIRENSKPIDYFGDHQWKKTEPMANHENPNKRYRKITLQNQYQEIVLSVPENMQFCDSYIVSSHSSKWAISILRKHGCELSKLKFNFHDSPEKPIFVSEFNEVKEEADSYKKYQ